MNLNQAMTKLCQSLVLLALVAVGLWVNRSAQAQANSWQAAYWPNTTLAGEPALVRSEAEINHNWGTGSPAPGIPPDRFSARWTQSVNLPAGRYRFTVTADDGVRLWVNERLIIDQWTVQSQQTFNVEITLPAEHSVIRLEYFDNTNVALVRLSWALLDGSATGNWQGEYFNNESLTGAPALVRRDANIAFNWAGEPPAPGVAPNRFSVRWTRTLDLPAGQYRFATQTDDGVRLWVNENLIIDHWQVQPVTTYNADVSLPGGPATIRMEYFEHLGGALAQLTWTPLATAPPAAPPPAIGAPVNAWHGEYFNNVTLSGSPMLVHNDPELNFNWGQGSPAPGQISPDRFSVRWMRTLSLAPGRYQFTARVDDGVRLWVGGQLILDDWNVQPVQSVVGIADVTGGATPVRLEYFENTGHAEAQLTWNQLGTAAPPPDAAAGSTATVVGARYLNVRTGPGVQFGRLAILRGGQTVEVLGRNAPSTWIQIRLPDGRVGWVNVRYLSGTFQAAYLPIVATN